ncbi:MAG: ABC transporter ATP-binding protein [Candidatus Marinimicrobia bacterium]|nr:ABC transporter ATP-binding protein [Candidatus Neomarinimicrobiota bacterium]
MEASITLKNVSKHFKKKYVLSGLSIGIEKGSTFAIIGRNGAGKSTLLRIMSTIMKPDNGTVYIDGKDISQYIKDVKKIVAYLPDHDIHDPWLSGIENLQKRAAYLGISNDEFQKSVMPLVKMFKLEKELTEFPVTYSRGVKRRLDIVQVLMGNPEVIILDEPTMGLDYFSRSILIQYILNHKGKKTFVLSSNEFSEIQTIADRWIVLDHGKIRFDGTLENMVAQIELPFFGNIEFRQGGYQLIKTLQHVKEIKEVRDLGKTIQIVTGNVLDFVTVLKKLNLDDVISISGSSIHIEEFLDQLKTDEAY